MDVDARVRKLRLNRERLDHGAAGAGRTGPEKLRERRLPRGRGEDAAKAGQVLADRAGQDRAAAGGPVEAGRAGCQPGHIPPALRERARGDLRLDAQGGEGLDDRGKDAGPGRRTDIAVGHQVDGSRGPGAIGRRSPLQIPRHLGHRVAPPRGHAEHHGEQVAVAARLEEPAVVSPAVPAAEAEGFQRHAIRCQRPEVVVARGIEPGRGAAGDGPQEHGHPCQRAGGKRVFLDEIGRQRLAVVDPPGKVARVDDAVDLGREPAGIDAGEDRPEDLGPESLERDVLLAAGPGKHEDVDRRDAAGRHERVGHGEAVAAGGVDHDEQVLGASAGTGVGRENERQPDRQRHDQRPGRSGLGERTGHGKRTSGKTSRPEPRAVSGVYPARETWPAAGSIRHTLPGAGRSRPADPSRFGAL